jgi:hypothetical protein
MIDPETYRDLIMRMDHVAEYPGDPDSPHDAPDTMLHRIACLMHENYCRSYEVFGQHPHGMDSIKEFELSLEVTLGLDNSNPTTIAYVVESFRTGIFLCGRMHHPLHPSNDGPFSTLASSDPPEFCE